MPKKFLDIKIVEPHMRSYSDHGNENVDLYVTSIDSSDGYHDIFSRKEPITDAEFTNAIDIILAKFIQDKLAHVSVDLDLKVDGMKKGEANAKV